MLASYTDMKSAVTNWMARADVAGEADDFIDFAEARLNRELDPIEQDTTLTGAANGNEIDVSSLSLDKPISLFLAQPGLNEVEMTPKAPGTFPFVSVSGRPRYYSVDIKGGKIQFDRPLDGEYPFRFRFSQRFSLSDDAPTNWLLTNHPDVYLAAVLVWGGMFIRDSDFYNQWTSVLEPGIASVKHFIAQSKRGNLTVDPMLQRIGRDMRGIYNGSPSEWPS